jgi:hypothetical protein
MGDRVGVVQIAVASALSHQPSARFGRGGKGVEQGVMIEHPVKDRVREDHIHGSSQRKMRQVGAQEPDIWPVPQSGCRHAKHLPGVVDTEDRPARDSIGQ